MKSLSVLNENSIECLSAYNKEARGQHYNRIARAVYGAGQTIGDPLSPNFEPHLITGLKGFDMARTMGDGFADRLRNCLDAVRREPALSELGTYELSRVDLATYGSVIVRVYNRLAIPGTLHREKQSHVAATKILHWLYPNLFLIVDSNVACAFRICWGVQFRKSTQPGYSADKYIACLQKAQNEIRAFGEAQFRELEPETPQARVFDKIAFIIGSGQKTGVPATKVL